MIAFIDVIKSVYIHFSKDRILAVAAGSTFFILLALFPAFASIVSLYGLFAHRSTILHELDALSRLLPGGAITVLDTELKRLLMRKSQALSLGFGASSLIALWSASGGFQGLVEGLNIAYDIEESRSFVRLSLLAILFTALAIVFAAIAVALGVALPMLIELLHLGQLYRAIFPIVIWPLSYGFAVVLLGLIYKFGPNRNQQGWRIVTPGSLVAALLWLVGTGIFKWYVQQFGNFDRVYGSLGAIVGFLTWIWISIVITLLGAEINRELERRRSKVA
jgi:membrane protein